MSEPYRPSNGTEGICFYESWCFKCERDAHMNSGKDYDACEPHEICSIIGDTLAYKISDPEYPKEWIYGEDGCPMCTAFVPVGTKIVERCERTIDMFDADERPKQVRMPT